MNKKWNKTIVVSAVNLVDGGTFTILRECLDALSTSRFIGTFRVIALVHSKKDLPANGIEYIEYPKSKSNYFLRFYYEYFAFHKLSKKLKPILWLSLHDMSPWVESKVQSVYMHNPSPFLGRPKSYTLRGIGFSSLYKYIYRINIHSNDYLIVQQSWLRDSFSEMFNVPKEKIIVARPATVEVVAPESKYTGTFGEKRTFVYASYPRWFKNFELICEAARILEGRGIVNFRVRLTIDGSENGYSKKLVESYSYLKTVEFVGLQPHEKMQFFYEQSDCLIFPSRAETWGLPISEYKRFDKPMILADLPYAHETAEGARVVAFSDPDNPEDLANVMEEFIQNKYYNFAEVPVVPLGAPTTASWNELFILLLNANNE